MRSAEMKVHGSHKLLYIAIIVTLICLALPLPASADGGIIIPDPVLWASIDERQQIAVIHLNQDETAQVDLFISMLDNTGQSHELTYFLPLGIAASDFKVVEGTALDFDRKLTEELDMRIENYSYYRQSDYSNWILVYLPISWIPINGFVLLASFNLLDSRFTASMGLGASLIPIDTYETANSFIAIYELNADADVQALAETEDINSSVADTLTRFRGQQIAVIKLNTQPQTPEMGDKQSKLSYLEQTQPGIHISWKTSLVPQSGGSSYAYPFGTGSAWANPIELTRVYVVSQPGDDFRVSYPILGEEIYDFTGNYIKYYHQYDENKGPAYAVSEAYGEYGRVWRATYLNSNSAQDVVVTQLDEVSRETKAIQRSIKFQDIIYKLSKWSWVVGVTYALAAWLIFWRWIMNRFLNRNYQWREARLWKDAFGWLLLYQLTCLIAIAIAWATFSAAEMISSTPVIFIGAKEIPYVIILGIVMILAAIIIFPVAALGLVNAFIFSRSSFKKIQVPKSRAFGAYMLVMLLANLAYFAFVAGCVFIVGAV
jgi:hypothetical protein